MQDIEGIILKLGTKDLNGNIFPKDCKIDYPEKVPLILGHDYNKPGCVVGNAKIIRNDDILSIQGEIIDNTANDLIKKEIYTHLGFFANKIKKKDNDVIEMFIRSIALLIENEAASDYCKIIKK